MMMDKETQIKNLKENQKKQMHGRKRKLKSLEQDLETMHLMKRD
jgi:hypothetical protein